MTVDHVQTMVCLRMHVRCWQPNEDDGLLKCSLNEQRNGYIRFDKTVH